MRKSTNIRAGLAALIGTAGIAAAAFAAPPKHNTKPTTKTVVKPTAIQLVNAPQLESIVRGKAGSVVLLNIWAST